MTPHKEVGRLKRNASVKWKIFLYMLIFSVVMLLILWLFQTVFLDSFYKGIKRSEVEKEAATLAGYIEDGQMDELEAAVLARGDLFVELIDEQVESYTVPGNYPEGMHSILSVKQKQELLEEVRQNGGSMTLRSSEEDFPKNENFIPQDNPDMQRPGGFGPGRIQESILHAEIVSSPEGGEYLLLVSAEITPVSATVQTLRLQLLWISGIMLVLAVGLALLISRNVARPIVKLNKSAHELERGNYGVRFEGGGYREVDELSGTLGRAATELAKTEELRRELIANVSHDLRTPLTLITGYAEMMRDIPGEDSAENMQVIIDEARRLSSLVADLLDLSQLQSGTGELHLGPFSLTAEAEEIVARFSKFSEPEGYAVAFKNGEDFTVEADSARIGQVIYNFLINAMIHGGEEKRITVRQRRQGDRVRLEVEDTGGGISEEAMPYIWDRYYKVDAVHTRPATGTGLGLSIVKSILEQHPGVEYGVEAQPGVGSTFWFSLPLAGEE